MSGDRDRGRDGERECTIFSPNINLVIVEVVGSRPVFDIWF